MTRLHRLGLAGLLLATVAGCGRKAPPLPPEHIEPAAPASLAARVVDGRVDVRFTLPTKNTNGTTPASLTRVDVFAVSLAAGEKPPKSETLPTAKYLVGHVDVKPVDAPEPADPKAPADTRPAQGDVATFIEKPPAPGPAPASADATARPSRLYVATGISSGRRPGPMSVALVVPFGPLPDAPQDVKITYDQTTLTLGWKGSAAGAFRVYAVDRAGKELTGGLKTAAPLKAFTFAEPVQFGAETCFAVRAVVIEGPVASESAAAGPVCTTPIDTFAPAAPTGLNAVSDAGVVQLAWNAVTAPDLAGYIVLRREVGTENMQRLKVVSGTTYDDTSVRPGVAYEYTVRAVDKATPPNESPDSEHKTVTARAPHASHKDF